MHSHQIKWGQLLRKWWDFQVSALHFISRWNKRYKFQLYSFLSIAITRMTLGSGTWQCQGRKNFTLVAHWENSYSYSFLPAFWLFDHFSDFLRAEVKITNWADKKLLIDQTLYGVSNWLLYSLSDACALFNHFCEFLQWQKLKIHIQCTYIRQID